MMPLTWISIISGAIGFSIGVVVAGAIMGNFSDVLVGELIGAWVLVAITGLASYVRGQVS